MTSSRPQLVYFIKPVGLDGPIKIGCSSVPAGRLEQIAVWSPLPLEVIGSIPGGYKEESFLHQCFADLHFHREWFHSAPRLRATIAAMLQAGSIEPAREKLKPIGSIKVRRAISEDETRYRSVSSRVRWACKKLREDSDEQIVHFAYPKLVSDILERWYGRDHYREPRKPVPPTLDEVAVLEAFIANPVQHGAVRNVIARIRKKTAGAA
jgi:hypothetical protein